MRFHRFYVNKPLGEEIVVDGNSGEKEIVHQWFHVFRFTSGDEVFLFGDGNPGTDFLYRITSISKDSAVLSFVSTQQNLVPKASLTLVQALVKKDTFETIVRQATELGVTRIIPLLGARSEKKNLNFERLKAISIEATEQSGRGTLPVIEGICSFEQAIHLTEGETHIVGSLQGRTWKELDLRKREEVTVWVGPEGGWSQEEEKRMLDLGFLPLKLQTPVLKADTAATALLSVLQN